MKVTFNNLPFTINAFWSSVKKRVGQLSIVSHIQRGFTLTELLVVIAIIAILSTFSISNFLTVRSRARDAQRKVDLKQLQSSLELYRSDQGAYPASLIRSIKL